MSNQINEIRKEIKQKANLKKAKLLQGFFKTGKGEYGEGDIFLGLIVPEQRKLAKKYPDLNLNEIQELLNSKIHEERLISLFILIDKYKKAKKNNNEQLKKEIFNFYLENSNKINNWDLVDLSAPNIVGDFLLDKLNERRVLYELVKSENIWDRRISILSTFTFIKEKDFKDSLNLAEILLNDKHDLIHKSVGWMLREIGKRDISILEAFLDKNYKNMPRTMLRYSIEKFPEDKRKEYLIK